MDLALPSDCKEFLNLLNGNGINLADLKSNKLVSGRAKDLADLEELP